MLLFNFYGKRVVYAPDLKIMPRAIFAGADIAIINGAFYERDQFYSLPAAERLRHALPGAQLVTLAGAGHLLPIERPVELAAIMRQFLVPLAQRSM
jgi:pimeloyl-ACP methyl ester carboxylesterase